MKTEQVLGSVTHTQTHTHLSKGPFHRPLQLLPPSNARIMGYLSKHIIFHCQQAARVAGEAPNSLLLSAIKLECRPHSASIRALRGSLPLMEAHYLPSSHCGNNVFLTVFLKITMNKAFFLPLLYVQQWILMGLSTFIPLISSTDSQPDLHLSYRELYLSQEGFYCYSAV